jgi:hypothetical protein
VLSLANACSETLHALEYDPYLDETWVAIGTSLRRHKAAGQQVFERAH